MTLKTNWLVVMMCVAMLSVVGIASADLHAGYTWEYGSCSMGATSGAANYYTVVIFHDNSSSDYLITRYIWQAQLSGAHPFSIGVTDNNVLDTNPVIVYDDVSGGDRMSLDVFDSNNKRDSITETVLVGDQAGSHMCIVPTPTPTPTPTLTPTPAPTAIPTTFPPTYEITPVETVPPFNTPILTQEETAPAIQTKTPTPTEPSNETVAPTPTINELATIKEQLSAIQQQQEQLATQQATLSEQVSDVQATGQETNVVVKWVYNAIHAILSFLGIQ